MKLTSPKLLLWNAFVCSFIAASPATVRADGAIPSASQGGISWQVAAPNDGVSLRVILPDGSVFEKKYAAGQSPSFTSQRGVLPDGSYTYELVTSPIVSPELRAKAQSARENGQSIDLPSGTVESGNFRVARGTVVLPNSSAVESGSASKRSQAPVPNDQVIPDDLIVQGSECVGFDCVNNEVFGFDTIKLKENNLRILFEDTSGGAFPTTDWRLTANDSLSGGASFFSIDDATAGRQIFRVNAGAPANSLLVDSSGRVGIGTATPILNLQVATGNSPALRLEQNASSGFTAQTWDVAGNEANFFIRDVTGGSRLPFRIRPGAPTSSIDIAATGSVGIGTASPDSSLGDTGQGRTLALREGTPAYGLLSIGNAGTGIGTAMGRISFGSTLYTGADKRTAVIISSSETAAIDNPTGNLRFFTSNAGSVGERMRVDGAGNVGIGTTAPTDKLSVNGTASKPGGGSWAVFSDERLKNIKGDYSSGLDAIMKLQPIRYEYKEDNALGLTSEGEHIGFGAQALQKIIPEAVTKNSAGYLLVDNDPILWTMLNAIKEQNAEIVELKNQVKRLQAEVVLQARAGKPAGKKVARTAR